MGTQEKIKLKICNVFDKFCSLFFIVNVKIYLMVQNKSITMSKRLTSFNNDFLELDEFKSWL